MKPLAITSAPLRLALAGAACIGVLFAGIELHAQAFARHDSDAPVHYSADRIELQDRQKRVVLMGNVEIEQAGLSVRAPRTLVNYDDSDGLTIERITATGGVSISRGNESARAEIAVYDFSRKIITMAGDVRLRRGTDTLAGQRLTIDLVSGISTVDGRATARAGSSADGRVTGSFAVPKKREKQGEER